MNSMRMTTLSCALTFAVSGHAFADVSGLQLRLTEKAAEIVLISSGDLGEPRVRSSRGEVEVWFPEVHDNNRITAVGDGTAVTRVRLRPGMGASAVLDIDLGGRVKVDPSLVSIEQQAGATVVRIPRYALAGHQPVATNASATPATVTNTSPATETVRAERAVPSSAALPTKKTPASISAKRATAAIASGGESKLPVMLWMSALLAIVLGGIKLWQRKTSSLLREPDIEVVATKRLGPGLQLFIVRAFGQEHLLSVNGKSTERIATNENFDDLDAAAAELTRPGFSLPNEPGFQLIPSRSVLAPSAAPKRSLAPEQGMVDIQIPRVPLTNSQSVAGLIRLREQLDRVN